MKNIRIIPRLDIKGPNLVKGIHLEGLRVLGKPEDFSQLYYEQGADELIYQDTVASLYQRNNLTDIINRTAKNIFIPLTVGGGIKSIEDIQKILRSGADKVSINTAGIENKDFINHASRVFGSSTIVSAIESIKHPDGVHYAYTNNGREYTGIKVLDWAKEVAERGAGEILLTSIDKEGTGSGFDIELIKLVTSVVDIPIIAHGGAGIPDDITDVIIEGGADAVAASSIFHYGFINSTLSYHDEEGNIEFIKQKRSFKAFGDQTIKSVKNSLIINKTNLRQ